MKITSYVSFLYCLCLMLASPTVQASEVRTAIFEGKPCINPPHIHRSHALHNEASARKVLVLYSHLRRTTDKVAC